jgi:hypothetical protein
MIDIKLDQMVKKEDLKKSDERFEKRIEAAKMEWDDKTYEIRKVVDELLEGLKNAGVKGMLEKIGKVKLEKAFASKDEVEEIKMKIKELRGLSDEMRELKKKEFVQAEHPTKEESIDSVREGIKKSEGPKETAKKAEEKPEAQKDAPGVGMSQEVSEGMESVEGVVEKLNIIIEEASEAVRLGQTDIAKGKYREALSLYDQLSKTATPEDAERLYDNIKKLYNRLRIYG